MISDKTPPSPPFNEDDRASEEFLAALANHPVLYDSNRVLALLDANPDQYLVDRHRVLHDDRGLLPGEISLHCIPARAYGDHPHRTTWVVNVVNDSDGPGDIDLGIYETEADGRRGFELIVHHRLDPEFPDPYDW